MITLEDAKKIATENSKTEMPIERAWETKDSFVIGFFQMRDSEGTVIPGQRSVVVNKENGKAKSFFPPDYPADYINEKNRIL